MTCVQYPDTVTFVETTPDKYGADVVIGTYQVNAAVQMGTGFSHGNNQDAITSDAVIYVNPEDDFVSDNYYRLEELLIVINLYGNESRKEWYKVINCQVAKDHQLCNRIDNIELTLKKTSEASVNVS